MLQKGKYLLLSLVFLILLGAAGFTAWGFDALPPAPEALASLQSSQAVSVQVGEWLVFHPEGREPEVGLIFYPGGRVDPRAYAPAAHALAGRGSLVVIVPMPLNLAVFGSSRADQVRQAFPDIDRWVIGGHSLGGAMAARYAYQNPDAVQGLVLWAAYPAGSNDLSSRDLPVVSIYGTLDGLADTGKIEASRALLPSSTFWVPVEGGNHAQFGWYGSQPGDNPAQISAQAQQDQVVEATWSLLLELQDR